MNARACLFALLVGCEHRAPITSCTQDLTGAYASGDRQWMVLDHGPTLEAFPLFPDVPGAGALEVAPSVIEWSREDAQIRGHVQRRYMQRADSCVAATPATIASCAGDQLEVVLAETSPPIGFAPCRWPRTEPSRRERWIRR